MALWIELPLVVQQSSESDINLSSRLTIWELSLWSQHVSEARSRSSLSAPSWGPEWHRLTCDLTAPVDSQHDLAHPCKAGANDKASDSSPEPRVYAFHLPSWMSGPGAAGSALMLRVRALHGQECVGEVQVPLLLSAATAAGPGAVSLLPHIPRVTSTRLTWPGTTKVHLAAAFGLTWLPTRVESVALARVAVAVPALAPSQTALPAASLSPRCLWVSACSLVEPRSEDLFLGLSPVEQLLSIGLSAYAARTIGGLGANGQPLLVSSDPLVCRMSVYIALCKGSGELLCQPSLLGKARIMEGCHVTLAGMESPASLASRSARWTCAWASGVLLDLPAHDAGHAPTQANPSAHTDVHLLCYCVNEDSTQDAPGGVCTAFGYMRLYDNERRFFGAPGCTLLAQGGHSYTFPERGVMRGTSSLRLYPGSPPFLPAHSEGKPLFAPSAPTAALRGDTYAHDHLSRSLGGSTAVASFLDVPAHLRLLQQAHLPHPQPTACAATSIVSSISAGALAKQLQVQLPDAGRAQAAGLFPHALTLQVIIVDTTYDTVADQGLRELLDVIDVSGHSNRSLNSFYMGQSTTSSMRSTLAGVESLQQWLLSCRGAGLSTCCSHDVAQHALPLAARLVLVVQQCVRQASSVHDPMARLAYAFTDSSSTPSTPASTAWLEGLSLAGEGPVGKALLQAVHAEGWVSCGNLQAASRQSYAVAYSLCALGDIAAAVVRAGGHGQGLLTALSSHAAVPVHVWKVCAGLLQASVLAAVGSLRKLRAVLPAALVACVSVPNEVLAVSLHRAQSAAKGGTGGLLPTDNAACVAAFTADLNRLARSLSAWFAVLSVLDQAPPAEVGGVLPHALQALLLTCTEAVYCTRAAWERGEQALEAGRMKNAASSIAYTMVAASVRNLCGCVCRALTLTGRKPAVLSVPALALLWAHACAALMADLGDKGALSVVLSKAQVDDGGTRPSSMPPPVQDAAPPHPPVLPRPGVEKAATTSSTTTSPGKVSANAAVLDKYKKASSSVGSSLVSALPVAPASQTFARPTLHGPAVEVLLAHRVGRRQETGMGREESKAEAAMPSGTPVVPRAVSPRAVRDGLGSTAPLHPSPETAALPVQVSGLLPFAPSYPCLTQQDLKDAVLPTKSSDAPLLQHSEIAGLCLACAVPPGTVPPQPALRSALALMLTYWTGKVKAVKGSLAALDVTSAAEVSAAVASAASLHSCLSTCVPSFTCSTPGMHELLQGVWEVAGLAAHAAASIAPGAISILPLALSFASLAMTVTSAVSDWGGAESIMSLEGAASLLHVAGTLCRAMPHAHTQSIDRLLNIMQANTSSWTNRSTFASSLGLPGAEDVGDGFLPLMVQARLLACPGSWVGEDGLLPSGKPGTGYELFLSARAPVVQDILQCLMVKLADLLSVAGGTSEAGSAQGQQMAAPLPSALLPALCSAARLPVPPSPPGSKPSDPVCSALTELVHALSASSQQASGADVTVQGGSASANEGYWAPVQALVAALIGRCTMFTSPTSSTRPGVLKTGGSKQSMPPGSGQGGQAVSHVQALDSIRLLLLLVLQLMSASLTSGHVGGDTLILEVRHACAWCEALIPPLCQAEHALARAVGSRAYTAACTTLVEHGLMRLAVAPAAADKQVFFAESSPVAPGGLISSLCLACTGLHWMGTLFDRLAAPRDREAGWLSEVVPLAAVVISTSYVDSTLLGSTSLPALLLSAGLEAGVLRGCEGGVAQQALAWAYAASGSSSLMDPVQAAVQLFRLSWWLLPSASLSMSAGLVLCLGGRRYITAGDKSGGPSPLELASPTADSIDNAADSLMLSAALLSRAHTAHCLWRVDGLSAVLTRTTQAMQGALLPAILHVGDTSVSSQNILSPAKFRRPQAEPVGTPSGGSMPSPMPSWTAEAQLMYLHRSLSTAFTACLAAQQWTQAKCVAAVIWKLCDDKLLSVGVSPAHVLESSMGHPQPTPAPVPTHAASFTGSVARQTIPVSSGAANAGPGVLVTLLSKGVSAGTIRRQDILAAQAQADAAAHAQAETSRQAIATTLSVGSPRAPAAAVAPQPNAPSLYVRLLACLWADSRAAMDACASLAHRSIPTDHDCATWAGAERRVTGGSGSEATGALVPSLCGSLVKLSGLLMAGVPSLPPATYVAVCRWGAPSASSSSSASLPQPTWSITRLPLDVTITDLVARLKACEPQATVFGPDAPVALSATGEGDGGLVFCGSGSRMSEARLTVLRKVEGRHVFVAPQPLQASGVFAARHIYVYPALPVTDSSPCTFRAFLARACTLALPVLAPGQEVPNKVTLASSTGHVLRAAGPVLHADGFKLGRDMPDKALEDASRCPIVALELDVQDQTCGGRGTDSMAPWVVGVGGTKGAPPSTLVLPSSSTTLSLPSESSTTTSLPLSWLSRSVCVPPAAVRAVPCTLLQAVDQWAQACQGSMMGTLLYLQGCKLEQKQPPMPKPPRVPGGLFGLSHLDSGILLTQDARVLELEPMALQLRPPQAARARLTVMDRPKPALATGRQGEYAQQREDVQDGTDGMAAHGETVVADGESVPGDAASVRTAGSQTSARTMGTAISAKTKPLAGDATTAATTAAAAVAPAAGQPGDIVFGIGGGVVDDEFNEEEEEEEEEGLGKSTVNEASSPPRPPLAAARPALHSMNSARSVFTTGSAGGGTRPPLVPMASARSMMSTASVGSGRPGIQRMASARSIMTGLASARTVISMSGHASQPGTPLSTRGREGGFDQDRAMSRKSSMHSAFSMKEDEEPAASTAVEVIPSLPSLPSPLFSFGARGGAGASARADDVQDMGAEEDAEARSLASHATGRDGGSAIGRSTSLSRVFQQVDAAQAAMEEAKAVPGYTEVAEAAEEEDRRAAEKQEGKAVVLSKYNPAMPAQVGRSLVLGTISRLVAPGRSSQEPLVPVIVTSATVPAHAAAGGGGAGGELATLRPAKDYQPSLGAVTLSSRLSSASPGSEAALPAHALSSTTLREGVPPYGLAVIPLHYAVKVMEARLESIMGMGGGRGLLPNYCWAMACGPAVLRSLLSDYAELKVLEREKTTTELRREYCRKEEAAKAQGIDTDAWPVPDWSQAVPRSLHPRIPDLERTWSGLVTSAVECVRTLAALLHAQDAADIVADGKEEAAQLAKAEVGLSCLLTGQVVQLASGI